MVLGEKNPSPYEKGQRSTGVCKTGSCMKPKLISSTDTHHTCRFNLVCSMLLTDFSSHNGLFLNAYYPSHLFNMIPTPFTVTFDYKHKDCNWPKRVCCCCCCASLAVILQKLPGILFTDRSGKISALWLLVAACSRVMHGVLHLISVT